MDEIIRLIIEDLKAASVNSELKHIWVMNGRDHAYRFLQIGDKNSENPGELQRTLLILRYGYYEEYEKIVQAASDGLYLGEILESFFLPTTEYISASDRVYRSYVRLRRSRRSKYGPRGWVEVHVELLPTRDIDNMKLLRLLRDNRRHVINFITSKILIS